MGIDRNLRDLARRELVGALHLERGGPGLHLEAGSKLRRELRGRDLLVHLDNALAEQVLDQVEDRAAVPLQQAADGGVKAAVVIEAVGHPAALETAIGLTAPGGRTITVGLPPPSARISLSPLGFVAEGRSLIGSYLGSSVPGRDIPRFVSLWQSGRLPVQSLVSSTIRLDDINEAMDHLADGTAVRQLIRFD